MEYPMSSNVQNYRRNQVAGTWRMISARVDPEGANIDAFGPAPQGMLVFTDDMHFVELLTDPGTPRFGSDARDEGTEAENRASVSRNIGFFGTYTVDDHGAFSGNRVMASTFPNWVGSVRTTAELRLTVVGDRMTEYFERPGDPIIHIEWQRLGNGGSTGLPRAAAAEPRE
ncbi:MAG: lipocalin-like domain-containing protein [Tardiphaga sp.]